MSRVETFRVTVLAHWPSYGEVPVLEQWILAGTLFCLRLDASPGAFLVSVLSIHQARGS